MKKQFYLLSADSCKDALVRLKIAKDDAISANREIMNDFGCAGVVRLGAIGIGLAYPKFIALEGFSVASQIEGGFWLVKPLRNTPIGKAAQAQIDDCSDLIDTVTWCLEKCLGIFGMVKDGDLTHFLVAKHLPDGRVLVSVPQGEWATHDPFGYELDEPVLPKDAEQIDEVEALGLLNGYLSSLKENVR
jgi:hypothetical protein